MEMTSGGGSGVGEGAKVGAAVGAWMVAAGNPVAVGAGDGVGDAVEGGLVGRDLVAGTLVGVAVLLPRSNEIPQARELANSVMIRENNKNSRFIMSPPPVGIF